MNATSRGMCGAARAADSGDGRSRCEMAAWHVMVGGWGLESSGRVRAGRRAGSGTGGARKGLGARGLRGTLQCGGWRGGEGVAGSPVKHASRDGGRSAEISVSRRGVRVAAISGREIVARSVEHAALVCGDHILDVDERVLIAGEWVSRRRGRISRGMHLGHISADDSPRRRASRRARVCW